LEEDVNVTPLSEVADDGYNDCINDDDDSYFIWLHEDYEEYRLAGYDYNDLSGSSDWVIFGNHENDDECEDEAHTFIAMEQGVCYKDNSNNYYRTDGSSYGRFATLENCEDEDLADGTTHEEDIEECV